MTPTYNPKDASSILRFVRRHPAITVRGRLPGDSDGEIAAAFAALEAIWPGHYKGGLPAFVKRMQTMAAIEDSNAGPVRLVPVSAAEMREGEVYLALATGGMGTVGAFCQGNMDGQQKARPFAQVFRIVQIDPNA